MSYRYSDEDLELPSGESKYPVLDLSDHPVIATVNILAEGLMEILGPFCWAALILLFLFAEFSSN